MFTRLNRGLFLLILTAPRSAQAIELVVNSTGDQSDINPGDGICQTSTGKCTLRAALQEANALGTATISFNVSGAGCAGVPATCTITPGSSLPDIQSQVVINGFTQPGSVPNTAGPFEATNAVPLIEITYPGSIQITGGPGGCLIKGLMINGGALTLIGTGANTVSGNYFGWNSDGSRATQTGTGIYIGNSSNNLIGGLSPADRNVIAGAPQFDIDNSGGAGNVIQGNFIGVNPAGTRAFIENGRIGYAGISIYQATGAVIGGSRAGAGNLIGGTEDGITLNSATQVTIRGNRIGTDRSGTLPIPNTFGVRVIALQNVIIGGIAPGEGNVIAFNAGAVPIESGTSISVRGNSIFDNRDMGIDLNHDFVTPNDACDGDSGPNSLQNFPVVTGAFAAGPNSTTVRGTLNSTANTTFALDFYSNEHCGASGFGEGKTYLGSAVTSTDSSCNSSFEVTLPVLVPPNARLTVTATDPGGNTSEFSRCVALASRYYTVAPCRVADTRDPVGPYGGPALSAFSSRSFTVGGHCEIPADASAVAFNFTVTQSAAPGDMRTAPGGAPLPLASTLNWRAGQTRANNAIVALGPSGVVTIYVDQTGGTVDLIIDVMGYFR